MSVRDENGNWKEEARTCTQEVKNALQPIFDKYKNKLSFEDLHYIVCTEFDEIILFECILRNRK